jgi:DNA-binding HxlR family transcriptional regulator
LIVRDALDGVRRFSEFQKGLGVSKGILAARLRDLVAHGILRMEPASDGSAYEDYVLTDKGRDLFPAVVALRQWGEDHCFVPGEPHSVLVENETGRRVGRFEIRSRNGQVLKASDTTVRKVAGYDPIPKRTASSRRMRRDTQK